MLLGSVSDFVAGDVRQFGIDYSQWLTQGEYVTSATVTVDPVASATVSNQLFSPDQDVVLFNLGGAVAGTTFTVTVAATTNLSQTRNDSIAFTCVTQ